MRPLSPSASNASPAWGVHGTSETNHRASSLGSVTARQTRSIEWLGGARSAARAGRR